MGGNFVLITASGEQTYFQPSQEGTRQFHLEESRYDAPKGLGYSSLYGDPVILRLPDGRWAFRNQKTGDPYLTYREIEPRHALSIFTEKQGFLEWVDRGPWDTITPPPIRIIIEPLPEFLSDQAAFQARRTQEPVVVFGGGGHSHTPTRESVSWTLPELFGDGQLKLSTHSPLGKLGSLAESFGDGQLRRKEDLLIEGLKHALAQRSEADKTEKFQLSPQTQEYIDSIMKLIEGGFGPSRHKSGSPTIDDIKSVIRSELEAAKPKEADHRPAMAEPPPSSGNKPPATVEDPSQECLVGQPGKSEPALSATEVQLTTPMSPVNIVDRLLLKGKRMQSRLVHYMEGRSSAVFLDVASEVHEDDETSSDAIRQNVVRTNNSLAEMLVPLRFRCASDRVFKEETPE